MGDFDASGFTEDMSMLDAMPLTGEDEKRVIMMLDPNPPLRVGDRYYLVSMAWSDQWNDWARGSGNQPGKIDNAGMVDESGRIYSHLFEDRDFSWLPEEAWNVFKNWYGCSEEIVRTVVARYPGSSDLFIDARPLLLKVSVNLSSVQTKFTTEVSKTCTTANFYDKIKGKANWTEENVLMKARDPMSGFVQKMEISPTAVLSTYVEDDFFVLVSEAHSIDNEETAQFEEVDLPSFTDQNTADNYKIPLSDSRALIVISDENANSVSNDENKNNYYNANWKSSYDPYKASPLRPSDVPGLVGLRNLGMTCFMNSSVQCLSNTAALREYFLSGTHTREINRDNPLGTKGELVAEFSDLISELWQGGAGEIIPRKFKMSLARFAPQFSGSQQHDSQELLSYLLDGLHEDLNRILKKPYVEAIEKGDLDDDVVAQLSWENHLKRNDSVVVDFFQGQYRSYVQCPECPKFSITFDPFMFLSLPLPLGVYIDVPMRLAHLDGSVWKYHLQLPRGSTLLDAKKMLSLEAKVPVQDILIVDKTDTKIYRVYDDNQDLAERIRFSNGLDCYQVDPIDEGEASSLVYIHNFSEKQYLTYGYTAIAYPSIIRVNKSSLTHEKIKELVNRNYSQYIKACDEHFKGEENSPTYYRLCLPPPSFSSKDHIFLDQEETFKVGEVIMCLWKEEVANQLSHLKEGDLCQLHSSHTQHQSANKTVSLADCLKLFSMEEKLTDDNMWYCSNCKEHRTATKKIDVWKLPPILIIQLKRFSYTKYLRDKIESFVEFPLQGLDMAPYTLGHRATDGPLIYDLYAVSNHMGGCGSGHYTAYCLHSQDNIWREYNDSHVSVAKPEEVVSPDAYILFYKLRQSSSESSSKEALISNESTTNEQEASTNEAQ